MNAAIANENEPDIHKEQAREMTKRQMHEWFGWMDDLLNKHRSRFVLREPSPRELEEHKAVLTLAIEHCSMVAPLIAAPEFSELRSRLQMRIRLLEDAYNALFDRTLSDEQAGKILQEVFPE